MSFPLYLQDQVVTCSNGHQTIRLGEFKDCPVCKKLALAAKEKEENGD
jgi:hypothetical protein